EAGPHGRRTDARLSEAPGTTPRVGVRRGRALSGRFVPPGDKSITHRALLLGGLASGLTRITGANPGEDCARSARAIAAMGADVAGNGDGWTLRGASDSLRAPDIAIDCGNSGTTMRLVAGLVAARPWTVTLSGDASLSGRPMRRIAEPLARMGAVVEGR